MHKLIIDYLQKLLIESIKEDKENYMKGDKLYGSYQKGFQSGQIYMLKSLITYINNKRIK